MFSRGRLDFRPRSMGGALEIRKRFEQEVLPHLDLLYTSAFHLTGDKCRASDLCEKALLRAYSFFPDSSAASNCRVWLLTILFEVFRARSSSREQAASTQQLLPRGLDRQHIGTESPMRAPSEGFELQDLFQNLPQDYRVTLFLVDVEELSYADAAKVLEVPIETIRARVAYGRVLMRDVLRHSAVRARGHQR